MGAQQSKVSRLPPMYMQLLSPSAMAKFMTGPPGGRTLPQTATKLSDLVGGIYGPGASVASTGTNAYRPAIKAGVSRAAGETWEDILEYYLVRLTVSHGPASLTGASTVQRGSR